MSTLKGSIQSFCQNYPEGIWICTVRKIFVIKALNDVQITIVKKEGFLDILGFLTTEENRGLVTKMEWHLLHEDTVHTASPR